MICPQKIPGRPTVPETQDTGATFWNELEEESELYDGREGDLMAAPWSLKVNTCGTNMKNCWMYIHPRLDIVCTWI